MTEATALPSRVMGLYDKPFWEHLQTEGVLKLQACTACGAFRYPPGPVCHDCLSPDHEWRQVGGAGEILSWVVFHRTYLPGYPAPYNVIAVRLAEGPILISNLEGRQPEGSWVGASVRLITAEPPGGYRLPRFVLA